MSKLIATIKDNSELISASIAGGLLWGFLYQVIILNAPGILG